MPSPQSIKYQSRLSSMFSARAVTLRCAVGVPALVPKKVKRINSVLLLRVGVHCELFALALLEYLQSVGRWLGLEHCRNAVDEIAGHKVGVTYHWV